MLEYDIEPDGLYFVYGVHVAEDGSKDRHHVTTVDVLDVAKAAAHNATRAFDYCYVKQFGQGTVYYSRRDMAPSAEMAPPAPRSPSSNGSMAL